jgi:hypothetical protein
MKKFVALAAVATVALFSTPAAFAAESSESVRAATESAAAAVQVKAGKMLYSNGQRVAAIYRVTAQGNPHPQRQADHRPGFDADRGQRQDYDLADEAGSRPPVIGR